MSLQKLINNKKRKQKAKIAKVAAIGTTVGLTAGAIGGILFAPKSGKETRETIAEKSIKTKNLISEKGSNAKAKISEKSSSAKAKISEYLESKKKTEDICEEVIEEVSPIEETL